MRVDGRINMMLIGMALLAIACIDPIEFDRPETLQNTFSIQGKLAIGESKNIRVSIRKVFDFSSPPTLVRAKSVTLFDELGNTIEIPNRQEGIHFLDFENSDFEIDYYKCYKLRIALFDDRVYESALECLLPVPTPEKVIVNKVEENVINGIGELEKTNLLAFSIDTPLLIDSSGTNARLLWELETTYKFTDSPEVYGRSCFPIQIDMEKKTCFYTESTFFNYVPFNGAEVSQSRINNQVVWQILPNSIFAEGLYLTIYQQSLTKTANIYWEQVHQLVSRTGEVFEATDAKVITNFTNVENPEDEVYGYFYATEEKLLRTYVSPSFADNPRPTCPEVLPFGTPPSNCCNCLTHINSTLEQPIWWEE